MVSRLTAVLAGIVDVKDCVVPLFPCKVTIRSKDTSWNCRIRFHGDTG
ncbi:MAG: hypothetical protein GX986_04005 [Firmicutes bacterium]|nr:hypothetical protein [Bacillota bacterium]